MKIISNDALIRRNARIAQVTMLGGLFVLAGGMFISFRYPDYFIYSLIALVLGFMLSQVGIYFSNRWSRRPRPDEILDLSLKGLDDKYSLYHFETPVSHLLLGPCGVWILNPHNQRGTISYSKGRWRQKGGNLYLKIFAQEGLGRPDLEIQTVDEKLLKYFQKNLPEEDIPDIHTALVFTNPQVEINIAEGESPPAETVYAAKLKDLVRKYSKSKTLSMEKVKYIRNTLENE
ncbi:hypothetical protein ACFLV7_00265 [Chloroflexota bacterium]